MKNYSLWIKIAATLQILTGLVHSISLFVHPKPSNEAEHQVIELMETTKMDLGAGFHKSMMDLFVDLSAHFTLAYILAGLINFYLLRKKVDPAILKGVLTINLVIFGISVAFGLVHTFLPPITFTSVTFLFLVLSRISLSRATS